MKPTHNSKPSRMSRRDFLIKGSSGAASILSPLWAAPLPDGQEQDSLVVALMGDPQWGMTPTTPQHVCTAMDDINTLDHAFLVVLGDCVQNKAALFFDYLEQVVKRSKQTVYSLPGNGDLGAGLAAYSKATGYPPYYSITVQGIRFIFTGTTKTTGTHRHICWMGNKQLEWLKKELASDTEITTVVFSHPPVFETTWHS